MKLTVGNLTRLQASIRGFGVHSFWRQSSLHKQAMLWPPFGYGPLRNHVVLGLAAQPSVAHV